MTSRKRKRKTQHQAAGEASNSGTKRTTENSGKSMKNRKGKHQTLTQASGSSQNSAPTKSTKARKRRNRKKHTPCGVTKSGLYPSSDFLSSPLDEVDFEEPLVMSPSFSPIRDFEYSPGGTLIPPEFVDLSPLKNIFPDPTDVVITFGALSRKSKNCD